MVAPSYLGRLWCDEVRVSGWLDRLSVKKNCCELDLKQQKKILCWTNFFLQRGAKAFGMKLLWESFRSALASLTALFRLLRKKWFSSSVLHTIAQNSPWDDSHPQARGLKIREIFHFPTHIISVGSSEQSGCFVAPFEYLVLLVKEKRQAEKKCTYFFCCPIFTSRYSLGSR